jgi:hypothetical protein
MRAAALWTLKDWDLFRASEVFVSVEVENGDLRPLYGRRGVAISWKRRYLQSKIEAEQEIPGITWSPWV